METAKKESKTVYRNRRNGCNGSVCSRNSNRMTYAWKYSRWAGATLCWSRGCLARASIVTTLRWVRLQLGSRIGSGAYERKAKVTV